MLIKYTGQSTVRIWGEDEWNPDNGHVVEVDDAETALHLLTHPPDDFAVDQAEPLVAVMDLNLVALLPFAGIVSLEGLAGANKETVALAAKQLNRDESEVRAWKKEAGSLIKQQTGGGDTSSEEQQAVEEDSDDNYNG